MGNLKIYRGVGVSSTFFCGNAVFLSIFCGIAVFNTPQCPRLKVNAAVILPRDLFVNN